MMFGGNFAPRGWAFCDGQLLPIAQNTALFSILGTTYGGDGQTTFGLPELRGRVAMHAGNGPGLTPRPQGQRSGTETTTLNVTNMPSHNHTTTTVIKAFDEDANLSEAEGNAIANTGTPIYASGAPDVDLAGGSAVSTSANVGNNQAFNNLQPYNTVRYIICLFGTFPSRS